MRPGLRLWIGLLAVPTAAVVALLLARGQTAVAPSPLAAVFASGLLVAGLLWQRRLPPAADYLLVLITATGAGWLLWSPGFPNGHDVLHHTWGLYAFAEAVRAGDLFPRWLHQLGLGMPLLQFYPPGSFYLALPFVLAGLSPVATLKGLLLLSSLLAGLAMYRAVRTTPASRSAALIAAVAYTWAPYAQFDRLYRVALAETAALIAAPLVLATAVAALRSPRPRTLAAAGVWLALLTLTHPLASSMIGTALVVWVVVEWWPSGPDRRPLDLAQALACLAGIALLAGLLGAFYLLPVAVESGSTSIDDAVESGGRPVIAAHGLAIDQPLVPRRWDRWRRSQPTGSEADRQRHEPAFYFGLPLLAALVLASLGAARDLRRARQSARHDRAEASSRSESSPASRTACALGVVGLLALLFSLRPFDQLLALAPWWRILQFSWRWLFVATLAGAWCCGLLCDRVQRLAADLGRARLATLAAPLLALALVVDGAPYGGSPSWYDPYTGVALQTFDRVACESGGDCWSARPLELSSSPQPIRLYADPGTALFPPASAGESRVDLVYWVYPEYYTPAIKALFVERSRLPRSLPQVGVSFAAFRGASEVVPLARGAPYAEWRGPDGRTLALPFERGSGEIRVTGLPAGAGRVVVKEQAFPGWRVARGGYDEEAQSTADGFLTAGVAPGTAELRMFFSERRWDRALGWALSTVTLLAVILLSARPPARSLWPFWRRSPAAPQRRR